MKTFFRLSIAVILTLSTLLGVAQTVGPTVPVSFANTGNWNDFSNFDRSFTVISSITLKSVDVVPVNHWSLCPTGGTSSLTVDLYKDGVRIDDVTSTVNCGAVNTIDLNFELLSGFYELRIRNVDNGQMALSNDATEKSITDVILLNEQPDGFSGAFFDWVIETKTGPVIPLPDTVRLCAGQTYDLNFGAYNGERWTSNEPFTTIDDANIRLEPTQSTVYHFEQPTLIPAGENIVQNGDFEAGNTGFTTDYMLNTALTTRGDYMVGNDAAIPLSVGADFNPGTTSGNMLVTKATPAWSGVKDAWCQTIDVFPNTTYQAEFMVKSGAFTNNPFVTASFNGGNWNFENTGSTWALYTQTWNSGANTTLEYCIQNHLAQTDGNVMLIDDVKLLSADPILAYTAVDSVVVIVDNSSTIDLGADTNICDLSTNPLTLDAGAGWNSYTWSNSASSQSIDVTTAGTYSVSVSDGGSCTADGEITITADNCSSCTLDTDGDGVCDDIDLDDDNDGILDTEECIDPAASWDFETPVVGSGNNNQGTTFQGWTLTGGGGSWINLIHPPYGGAVPQTAASGDQYVEVSGSGNFERVYTVTESGPLTVEIDFASWANGTESTQLFIYEADGITLVAQSQVITTVPPSDWNNAWGNIASVTANVTPGDYVIKFALGNFQAFDDVRISSASTATCDLDNDGIINSLDLDSDGDDCPDALEGGDSFTTTDIAADSSLTGAVDANGVPVSANGGQTVGASQDVTTQDASCCDDYDSDGVCDAGDLDDDNDGILDELECNFGGTNDFQWSSPPNVSGNTATGTINGITYTYTSSTTVQTTSNIYNHGTFPASYNIPNTTSIKNVSANSNTLTFDGAVLNPVLIFSSIGNPGTPVPIDFGEPIEVLWSTNVVENSSTRITGTEGFAIVRINGIFNSISFDYLANENYANFMFGGDFVPTCGDCDIDNDTFSACFDNDSDGDGCWDALEGDGGILSSQVDANGMITGGVDANGVPLLANGGQSTGSSLDENTQSDECAPISLLCGGDVDYNDWSQAGVTIGTPAANWVVAADGQSVTQTANAAPPTFYIGNDEYLNVRFQGKISVNTTNDDDWIGMVFGYQNPTLQNTYPIDLNLIALSWKQSQQGAWPAGFTLFKVDQTVNSETEFNDLFRDQVGSTVLGTNYGTGLGWNDNTQHTISVDYTGSRILVYVDDALIFDVDGCFDPGKVGFYNDSQDNVQYSDFTYQFIGNIDMVDDTLCLGEQLDMAVYGGTSCTSTNSYPTGTQFNWDLKDGNMSTDTDISHVYADTGTYEVQLVISDGASCSDTTTRIVKVGSYPVVNIGNDTAVCDGQIVTLDAGNVGADFQWSNGATSQTIQVNTSGDYDVMVTNWANCTTSDTMSLILGNVAGLNLGIDTIICMGDSIMLDASSSATEVTWSTGVSTEQIYVGASAVYDVLVEDTLGCQDRDTLVLSIRSLPVVDLGLDTTICDINTLTLDAENAGMQYAWSTTETAQTITVDLTGEYSVLVTDDIGCEGRDTFNLIVNPMPSVDLGIDTTICAIDSLVLDATNTGFDYDWNSNETTAKITVNQTGTYYVTVSDSIGCLDRDTLDLVIRAMPVVNLHVDTSICRGDELTLDAENTGLDITWNTTETTQEIVVSTAGVYSVIVTDDIGCATYDTFELEIYELPIVSLTAPTDPCYRSGLVELTESPTGNGGVFSGEGITSTGFYDPTTTSLVVDASTWAYYTYTDENNCVNKDSTAIILRLEPDPVIGIPDTIVCAGSQTQLTVSSSGMSTYEWYMTSSFTMLQSGSTYDAEEEGYFFVLAVNDYCYAYSDTVLVELVTPQVSLSTDMEHETILEGESTNLTASSPSVTGYNYTYEWEDLTTGDQNAGANWTVSPEDSTYYLVTATLRGCPIQEEILVPVTQLIVLADAFTPNGDEVNDEFTILNIEDYPGAQVTVYNRWGNVVYDSYGGGTYKSAAWDGTMNGKDLPVGVYYYTINPNNGRLEPYSGSIQLFK